MYHLSCIDDDDDDTNVCAYNGVLNHGDGDVSRKPPIALSAIARTHKPFPDCDDCEDVTILTMIMMM